MAPGLDLKFTIIGGHANADLAAYIPPSADEPGVVHMLMCFGLVVPHS